VPALTRTCVLEDAPRPSWDSQSLINHRLPVLTHGGFTLVELLVALALLGVVATGIHRVLLASRRAAHAQSQWIDLQRNLRAAGTVLSAQFRELAASDSDIYAMSNGEIQMRAMRQFSVICREPPLGGRVVGLPLVVFRQATSGPRFAPLDSILVFYEDDEANGDDDGWVPGVVTHTVETSCPDGSPGDELAVNLRLPTATQRNSPGVIPRGAPIRGFEAVRYAAYRAGDGLWYLGLEVPGTSIQPLVGPLLESGGLELRYQDAAGNVTAVPARVGLVEIRVRGRTVGPVWNARQGRRAIAEDSVVLQVALRNNRSGEW
jgi:prepilin-type N-terminal cleavage/methylation domain-containing protein